MGVTTYTPTIGLEIHAELKTQTKMFCRSRNDPHTALPNTHICPVCTAHPGTLPVINKAAVHHVLRVGIAVGGTIADYTEFDRKSYFYPDLPKGYQISQYKHPLVSGGRLLDVALTRIHLEEDTARSQHPEGDTAKEYSLIDFNRAGVPLMELVTEPVIHDARTAARFAEELQLLLRTLGISDANMEKGEMRVEANISVSPSENFGTKVEVKNLNSFRSVERAIDFEIKRQTAVLERGEKIIQETRGWDDGKQTTFSQRLKENSHDYRYFPEPDITKMKLSTVPGFSVAELAASLPELPSQKRERYTAYGIKADDREVLVRDSQYARLFAEEIEPLSDVTARTTGLNLLLHEIRGKNPSSESLARLQGTLRGTALLCAEGILSVTAAKTVLSEILEKGGDPKTIAERKGLLQVHDSEALIRYADEVIAENAAIAEEVRAGKSAALQFLVGQGMKKSKGSANPKELAAILKKKIEG